jgi:hypothetical protein
MYSPGHTFPSSLTHVLASSKVCTASTKCKSPSLHHEDAKGPHRTPIWGRPTRRDSGDIIARKIRRLHPQHREGVNRSRHRQPVSTVGTSQRKIARAPGVARNNQRARAIWLNNALRSTWLIPRESPPSIGATMVLPVETEAGNAGMQPC